LLVSKTPTDAGSAPVEFLAFGVPGVLVTLVAAQISYAAYLNTVAYDAAAEAASVASLANGTDQLARARAERVLGQLTGVRMTDLQTSVVDLPEGSATSVSVSLVSPMLFFGGVPVEQQAESFNEPR
jgi:hypothetical protein